MKIVREQQQQQQHGREQSSEGCSGVPVVVSSRFQFSFEVMLARPWPPM